MRPAHQWLGSAESALLARQRRVAWCGAVLARPPAQAAHGPRYKPPTLDANAPDLYLPLMGLFTYTALCAVTELRHGSFSPEACYLPSRPAHIVAMPAPRVPNPVSQIPYSNASFPNSRDPHPAPATSLPANTTA